MKIFPIVSDEELSSEAQIVFDDVLEKFGSIPVFYRLFATAPPLIEAYWLTYKKVIFEGVLPIQVKELIFLAVARKRQCVYCSSAHLAICDIFEVERSTLESIMNEIADFKPERIAALLTFCLASLDDPDEVSDADFQRLYEHGITQREIMEALYTVGYADSGIFLAKAVKVDVDTEIKNYLEENKLSIGFI